MCILVQTASFPRFWRKKWYIIWKPRFFFHSKKTKQKIQKGQLKKNSFSSLANSQYFFMKISWIGPSASKIYWCKGYLCGSIYVAVRLSDISSKIDKKCIFGVFRLFLSLCQTASQPYRLSHTNVFRINQFYQPKDQPMKFSWKNIKNWRSWKKCFFLSQAFNFFFSKKKKNK